ncbi:thiolase family protein [Kineobactrum salinum]|uniref:Thiolase family protein n=1 Tax=Kineobactrum salinum TaxID=2708301 RepID=A0A6C0U502_9GAMM|nr:thiolase family protein [Kineobactrum salinum]QIB64524.1 thiolase family protein [Kineobactrum salinum]
MRDYSGIALTAPVSFGYAKQSPHGAAWFIGSTLREMLLQAGIDKAAVDGLAVSSFSLGLDSAITLTQNFQLSPRWIDQLPYGGAAGLVALRRAARAIQAGDADIIACIGGDGAAHRGFERTAAEFSSFTVDASFPYGGGGPNTAFGLITQNYMERYGARREDLGLIPVAQRYNANHYPAALLGHKSLSLEQYLASRPIAGPLHLFDCVMPCAGGEGFLMMSEQRARELGLPYCVIRAAGELHNAHPEDEIQFRGGWTEYADQLYSNAGLEPAAIDILQTYDDYPVISMLQMEDLGFCAKGEAAQWLRDTDLRFDGSGPQSRKLAHNTSGGQLSVGQAGSAAGYMGIVETIRQLTDRAGRNQVPEARHAMVSGFGMINYDRGLCSAAAILGRAGQ